ncbi:MAG: tetratricopeptide repeat protein [Bacteroidota bacterium]
MRSRSSLLPVLLTFAFLLGGAAACSSDPNVESAKLALQQDNYDEALEQLNIALETNPENVEALTLKVQVLSTQIENAPLVRKAENADELRQSVMTAERVAPADPDVMQMSRFAWATLMNSGNNSIRSDATPASQATELFAAAAAIAPDSAASHFGLGLSHLIGENAEEAATALQRAVELDPADANASIYLSRAYLQQGRASDALDVLSAARETVPEISEDYDRVQQEYLNALASSGQTDRAVAEFEEEVENYPDDPLIRYNYGTLLLNVERYGEAIEQFEAATDLDSENADAYYNLGVANVREAGRVETEAGELDLSQQEEYDALIAQRDEFLDSALGALETARELTDDDGRPAVCNTLLQIYNSLGRAGEAEEAAECAGVTMN